MSKARKSFLMGFSLFGFWALLQLYLRVLVPLGAVAGGGECSQAVQALSVFRACQEPSARILVGHLDQLSKTELAQFPYKLGSYFHSAVPPRRRETYVADFSDDLSIFELEDGLVLAGLPAFRSQPEGDTVDAVGLRRVSQQVRFRRGPVVVVLQHGHSLWSLPDERITEVARVKLVSLAGFSPNWFNLGVFGRVDFALFARG